MFSNKNKQNQGEESIWEVLEQKIKLWMHSLIHELLQSQVSSPLVFNILTFIETLQFNYYAIHPLLENHIWRTSFLDYYRQFVQYFQVNFVLRDSTEGTFLTILYICFSINVAVVILMIVAINKIINNQKKNSTFLSYGIKFLSTYALLVTTILPLPIFNTFLATLICNKDSPYTSQQNCYSGLYFLHLTAAVLGIIIFILLCLTFSFLYIDMNPSSTIPFASPQTIMPLIKLGKKLDALILKFFVNLIQHFQIKYFCSYFLQLTIILFNFYIFMFKLKQGLKLLLPFYVTIDYGGKFIGQYIVVLNVFFLLILFQRYRTAPYFNKKVQNFVVFCESLLFWVAFCALITTFLDKGSADNIGLLYLVICLPMLWNVYRSILNHRKSYFIQLAIKDFKKDEEVEIYVMIIVDLIENREHADSRIKLEGILKYHSKYCPKDTCYCRQLVVDDTKDEETQLLSKKWYLFVKSILEDSLEKFVKSSRLHLLHAHIQHEKLKNKFKALFELMIAKEQKANIQEEFSIFRFSNQIEDEIKDSDEKTGDTRNVDVNKIVLFQKRFIEFQGSIDKSVQLHLDFWRELLEENPEIQKIENMGSKITQTVEQVRDQFQKLRDIYSNHIKCLEIYGYFLKDIVNDDIEGEKILDNVKYAKNSQSVNKQFIDQDRLKYGENSNTAILTVSGNYGQIGVVTNLNNEITRILGWSKGDIIDQNISRIMPKVYADLHDKLMEHYLGTSEGKVIGVERTVLCINKNQFLVPCTLMIKVLPNLEEGIQIVGFLKDIDNSTTVLKNNNNNDMEERVHYMIYRTDNDNYVLQGVTQSCYTSLGIPASLMYGNSSNNVEFTVDSICPDLLNPENYEELKSPAGILVTIDTTTVQQNFLLDEDESDDDDYQEQDSAIGQTIPMNNIDDPENGLKNKKSKFKRTKVRMNLIEEQIFDDRKVNVVRFVEVEEGEEGGSKLNQQLQGSMMDQQQMKELERNQMNKQQWNQQQQNADRDEDFNASDRDSNISNASVNDEVRQLKDFKSLISEKTVPKSISILKRTVITLIIIILVLSGVELSFKISQESKISTGVKSIFVAFKRANIMSDVNFYSRRVSNIANEIRVLPNGYTGDKEAYFKDNQNKLAENVNLLQTNQFSNMKNLINLDGKTYNELSTKMYDIQFQQQQKTDVKTYQNLLTDAMIQMITSSSSLANATSATFKDTQQTYVDSTLKNFFYVVSNGLFVLRKGSEFEADKFYTFYYDETDNFENSFRIIMILGIVFLLLSLVVLIPYVFKVHKTNTRVLSLFGMIPIQEIKELATRCENYSVQFIDDKKNLQGEHLNEEIEDNSPKQDQSPKEDHSDLEIDGENNENDMEKDEIKNTQGDVRGKNGSDLKNELKVPLSQQNQRGSKLVSQQKTNGEAAKKTSAKDGKKKTKQQEEEEGDSLRSQKLMNSKDNNRKKVIFQFLLFSLIFITYFVVSFVLELNFLQNMRKIFSHLNQVSQRNAVIKYMLVYMVEQVTVDSKQMQDGEDNLTKFINYSYEIENSINTSSLKSYPSEFDSYFSKFSTANYNNFCSIFPVTATLTQVECEAVNSSMLKKGLKISITSYVEGIRNMITEYVNTNDKTLQKKQTLFSDNKYVVLENMQFYMCPMVESLNEKLLSSIQSYLDNQNKIEIIKFGVFVAFLIIVFIGVWLPYLQQLSHKIWRTKGMLNMIPMDIITKDQNLKQAFVSGDILQAVK